ncbi:unannotated protein [freshwater metagenome]|uniref:Unannotated protein n=1 Tax=freshwater metagenome TaxID=449393 RepID=A0A6J7SB58_9ZZZZ
MESGRRIFAASRSLAAFWLAAANACTLASNLFVVLSGAGINSRGALRCMAPAQTGTQLAADHRPVASGALLRCAHHPSSPTPRYGTFVLGDGNLVCLMYSSSCGAHTAGQANLGGWQKRMVGYPANCFDFAGRHPLLPIANLRRFSRSDLWPESVWLRDQPEWQGLLFW